MSTSQISSFGNVAVLYFGGPPWSFLRDRTAEEMRKEEEEEEEIVEELKGMEKGYQEGSDEAKKTS